MSCRRGLLPLAAAKMKVSQPNAFLGCPFGACSAGNVWLSLIISSGDRAIFAIWYQPIRKGRRRASDRSADHSESIMTHLENWHALADSLLDLLGLLRGF